jgi:hypothetical protein
MHTTVAERIRETGVFEVEDIPSIVRVISTHDIAFGSPWDDFRHAHLRLPSWFRGTLDPLSDEYAQQQKRLWSILSGISGNYMP